MMKSDKIFPLHPYKGETHKMTNYDQIRPGYSRLSNNFVTFMPYITDISFFMPHSNKIFLIRTNTSPTQYTGTIVHSLQRD